MIAPLTVSTDREQAFTSSSALHRGHACLQGVLVETDLVVCTILERACLCFEHLLDALLCEVSQLMDFGSWFNKRRTGYLVNA